MITYSGQGEDFKKFGVDEETPSGVEDVRNSTQRTGSSLNLMLSDVSSIRPPPMDENEGIVFDELPSAAEENFLHESEEEVEDVESGEEVEDDESGEEVEDDELNGEESYEEPGSDAEASDFTTNTNEGLVPDLRKNMKAKSKVTIIERGDKTFLVCPCGYSSTIRSGNQTWN